MVAYPNDGRESRRKRELTARIAAGSAAAILDLARRRVATTDATRFGDTEFEVRIDCPHYGRAPLPLASATPSQHLLPFPYPSRSLPP